MDIHFQKYQGTGNDFIIIDNRYLFFPKQNPILVRQLCDRHFGIGADGLILIENHPDLDYRMVYYNADGSESLCGNGSRCGFAFANTIGIVGQEAVFETTDGIHAIKEDEDLVKFQLFDQKIPGQLKNGDWYINTGSPHYVIESKDLDTIDIVKQSQPIRNSDTYSHQNGTNVNFATFLSDHIAMRTYERGVENETLSCGTGATAVGLIAGVKGMKSPVSLKTKGGCLKVYFTKKENEFTDIWLAGPATKVFEGTISI